MSISGKLSENRENRVFGVFSVFSCFEHFRQNTRSPRLNKHGNTRKNTELLINTEPLGNKGEINTELLIKHGITDKTDKTRNYGFC